MLAFFYIGRKAMHRPLAAAIYIFAANRGRRCKSQQRMERESLSLERSNIIVTCGYRCKGMINHDRVKRSVVFNQSRDSILPSRSSPSLSALLQFASAAPIVKTLIR